MTALLYYSYSRGLNQDKLVEIDRDVSKNTKLVCVFIRKLPLNTKRKAKRLCFYVTFSFVVSQPLAPCLAIGIPAAPAIHRLHSIGEDLKKNTFKTASVISSRMDKVILAETQIKELDTILVKYMSGSLSLNQTILELRDGDLY